MDVVTLLAVQILNLIFVLFNMGANNFNIQLVFRKIPALRIQRKIVKIDLKKKIIHVM